MCSRPMQVRQGRSSIHPASRPGSTQDLSGLGEPEGRCGERGDVGRMPPGEHPEQVAPGLPTTPGSDLPTCPAQGPLVWASEEPIEPYFSPCTAPGALFPDSRRGASPGIPPPKTPGPGPHRSDQLGLKCGLVSNSWADGDLGQESVLVSLSPQPPLWLGDPSQRSLLVPDDHERRNQAWGSVCSWKTGWPPRR